MERRVLIAIFLSFVFGFEDRSIKLFGLGLAAAIFVDATLVRLVLVPATMELLGDANWWLPKWLARIVPNVNVDADLDLELLEDIAKESGAEPAPDRRRQRVAEPFFSSESTPEVDSEEKK